MSIESRAVDKMRKIIDARETPGLSESAELSCCAVCLPAHDKKYITKCVNTAWAELREKNHSIPSDVLDFMREIALWRIDTA